MKYLVFSDSHGNGQTLFNVISEWESKINGVIFLGDGIREFQDVTDRFPRLAAMYVRGNCDYAYVAVPDEKTVEISGRRIVMLHGHTRDAKSGTYALESLAASEKADLVLFGHTHRQTLKETEDGRLLLNPGSTSSGRYAVVDIGREIEVRLMENG